MAERVRTRRLGALVAAVVLGGLVLPVAATTAAAQTSPTQPGGVKLVDCKVTSYRLLFWPDGHGKVKSQKFPAYAIPHTELYAGTGGKYTDADSLGYIDSAGQGGQPASCTSAPFTAPLGGPVPAANLATTSKPTALACTAPTGNLLLTVPTPAKAQMSIVVPTQTVAAVLMSGTASTLQYDTTMCKVAKLPK